MKSEVNKISAGVDGAQQLRKINRTRRGRKRETHAGGCQRLPRFQLEIGILGAAPAGNSWAFKHRRFLSAQTTPHAPPAAALLLRSCWVLRGHLVSSPLPGAPAPSAYFRGLFAELHVSPPAFRLSSQTSHARAGPTPGKRAPGKGTGFIALHSGHRSGCPGRPPPRASSPPPPQKSISSALAWPPASAPEGCQQVQEASRAAGAWL